ncbi:MAG: hypothetical protein LBF40_03635 [Deltaproteobacteria bacterium]|jgi:hypothetical protein|nr:hypothetical protein [Deltaproteobacteria bacterium]
MKDCIISLKSSKEIDHILYFVILFIITFFLLTTIIGSSSSSADTENGVSTSETTPTQSKNTDESSSKFSVAGIQFGMTKEEAISAINKINPKYKFFGLNEFSVQHFFNDKGYETENENPKNKGFAAYLACEQGCAKQSDYIAVLYYEGVGVWAIVRKHRYNENAGPTKDTFISYLINKYNIPNIYKWNEDKLKRSIEDNLFFDVSNNFASKEICPNLSKAIATFRIISPYYSEDYVPPRHFELPVQPSPSCGTYVSYDFRYEAHHKSVTEYTLKSVSIKHRYQYLLNTDQVLTPYEKEQERLNLERESKLPDL